MKRMLVAVLLAMALVLAAGPAVPSTTTSCGMAYVPPFFAFHVDSDKWAVLLLFITNITDDVVHAKITTYYNDGTVQFVWETDIAPHGTYYRSYDGFEHPADPLPSYSATIEWTAQFCTQKALIANANISHSNKYTDGHTWAGYNVPINGGLPF